MSGLTSGAVPRFLTITEILITLCGKIHVTASPKHGALCSVAQMS